MPKLRHVAIKCDDLPAAAEFYTSLFEMKEIARRGDLDRGGAIYLSDGVVNLALIKITDPTFPNAQIDGLNHIGFLVDDADAFVAKAESFGCTRTIDEQAQLAHAAKHNVTKVYEVKMKTPDGVSFDVTDIGWPGAGI